MQVPTLEDVQAARSRVYAHMRPSPLPLYTYWNIEELYLTK